MLPLLQVENIKVTRLSILSTLLFPTDVKKETHSAIYVVYNKHYVN